VALSGAENLARPNRAAEGRKFRLQDVDPGVTRGIADKEEAKALLRRSVERSALGRAYSEPPRLRKSPHGGLSFRSSSPNMLAREFELRRNAAVPSQSLLPSLPQAGQFSSVSNEPRPP